MIGPTPETLRHIAAGIEKPGYRFVALRLRSASDAWEADRKRLERIKDQLANAATAEYEDTGMGYTERMCSIAEEILKELEDQPE